MPLKVGMDGGHNGRQTNNRWVSDSDQVLEFWTIGLFPIFCRFMVQNAANFTTCLDSLFFLGATLARKSRRNFMRRSCSSVVFISMLKRLISRKKFLAAEYALGEVTCSASYIDRIAGLLEVGKDIVSHFKHSDLSTNALLEQQREINPTMRTRKFSQMSWKNKHQLVCWVIVVRTSPLLEQRPRRDFQVLRTTASALGLIGRGELKKRCVAWSLVSVDLIFDRPKSLYLSENGTVLWWLHETLHFSPIGLTLHTTFFFPTQELILLRTTDYESMM